MTPAEFSRRLRALAGAARLRGEVYTEGERNTKLAAIHREPGGFAVRLRVDRGGNVRRSATGATRAGARFGRPARNFAFLQPAEAARLRRLLRDGVVASATGGSTNLRAVLANAADLAAGYVRMHIAPDAAIATEYRGMHGPVTTELVQVPERMAPLSPAYRARKLREVGPRPILYRTGELRSSVHARVVGR